MSARTGTAERTGAPPGPRDPGAGSQPRHARERAGPAGADTWILRAAVAALVLGVAVFGSLVAVRTPVYSPVDEGAHFEYVQYIAQHGGLPVLGRHYAPLADLLIDPTFSTRHYGTDPEKMGIVGLAYEDFQPPLYYALAVPAYELSGNLHTKVVVLRFFDLLLLAASVLLAARLSRKVLKERWLVGFTAGLLVLALPGVVVRAVTLSNTALTILVTIAGVTELWVAWESDRPSRLALAGGLLGLGLLTSLFSVVLVPVYLLVALGVVARTRSRRDLGWAGAGAGIALLLVGPWLAFNLVEYHALTAASLARSEQLATVNPHHLHYGPGLVVNEAGSWLVSPVLPQEWSLFGHPVLNWVTGVLAVAVIPLALLLGLSLGRRVVSSGSWMLALPWVLNVLLCAGITYFGQWQTVLARYTYPTLPLLAVFGAVGAVGAVRDRRVVTAALAGLTVGVLALWIGLVPQIHAPMTG
jgi:4-amino-4-deoxy-L-arabinose transferase-like glycosyltransferase